MNGFLSSIGCINLCTRLPNAAEIIDYPGSRRRVIAIIEDMKAWLGKRVPIGNGRRIPDAWAVIDGEPQVIFRVTGACARTPRAARGP